MAKWTLAGMTGVNFKRVGLGGIAKEESVIMVIKTEKLSMKQKTQKNLEF